MHTAMDRCRLPSVVEASLGKAAFKQHQCEDYNYRAPRQTPFRALVRMVWPRSTPRKHPVVTIPRWRELSGLQTAVILMQTILI